MLTRRIGLTTKSDRPGAVAIVGGGASGTILAAQLARRGIRSLLIDGGGLAARGLAYSTSEDVHLLNVRANAMSAWASEPGHFARRFAAEGGEPTGFAQRRLFGRYLGEILGDAVKANQTEVKTATAVRAERSGKSWRIGFHDGSAADAEVLVLAMGNEDPEELAAFSAIGDRFIGNPWRDAARAAVERLGSTGEPALLLGTGLTMVDLVLSLDRAGHKGRILAISRRGLAPRSHADVIDAPVERHALPGDLRGLLRWLRRRSGEVGWRSAVDSLRPHSHAIWQAFRSDERERFLRHARPWWDVHRHRIAPQVADTVARLVAEGRLEISAGKALEAADIGEAIRVAYHPRGSRSVLTERFAFAFNCTGPLHSIARSKNPLIQDLLASGHIKPDPLGIGLDVDDDCRAGQQLWALGALTKGRFWETIAVPDIREQAAIVADGIEREIGA